MKINELRSSETMQVNGGCLCVCTVLNLNDYNMERLESIMPNNFLCALKCVFIGVSDIYRLRSFQCTEV